MLSLLDRNLAKEVRSFPLMLEGAIRLAELQGKSVNYVYINVTD